MPSHFCHPAGIVSIHAPTRGATSSPDNGSQLSRFQSTLPRGERLYLILKPPNPKCFNPRSHAGSDARGRLPATFQRGFNPRSHAGSDQVNGSFSSGQSSFNPRSHGERLLYVIDRVGVPCFNPRSHAGSDLFMVFALLRAGMFQSTLPRGERLSSVSNLIQVPEFQSTLPRGERRVIATINIYKIRFQSTLPRGERLVRHWSLSPPRVVSIHAPTRGATCVWCVQ